MPRLSKITSRIVLVGGGHSHVQFLKSWRENPLDGVEVVMVSKDAWTPYSGMLPSRLAGWYTDAQLHFDLLNLCAQSGVTFFEDEVSRVDATARLIHLKMRPPLAFDIASVNVGVTPDLPPGAEGHPRVLAVKPIGALIAKWEELWKSGLSTEPRWVIVGAGAAGFELALISAYLFRKNGARGKVVLLDSSADVLSAFPRGIRAHARRLLAKAGVEFIAERHVTEVRGQKLLCRSGGAVDFEQVLFTTGAKAPRWLAESGLPVDDDGFVRVDGFLRADGLADVFAAGDCVHFLPRPLPKSGVFAVREGPTLVENLRRRAVSRTGLRKYRPQRKTLALLTSGDRRALMAYRGLHLEGPAIWRWKSRIDLRFMEMFGPRPVMPMEGESNTCGGCGGKIGAVEVRDTVERLRATPEFARLLPTQVEDVGVLGDLVATVDGFRTFTPDLNLFGQVAVWNALNDFYASGAKPGGVTVYATLPEMSSHLRRNQLQHMMAGVLKALTQADVPLLNAHSAEAEGASLVVSAVGTHSGPLWTKSELNPGDVLILTRSLGTGVLLQAQMLGALPVSAWRSMNAGMLANHMRLPARLGAMGVRACTDISGFGLGGHVVEMAEASRMQVRLHLDKVPRLPGFDELARRGFRSRLAERNASAFGRFFAGRQDLPPYIWDPQTHGPLLLAVPATLAGQVVEILVGEGFKSATIIGEVVGSGSAEVTFS